MFNFNLMSKLLAVPGILLAITVASYGKALAATIMGDDTPRREGRLTMYPPAHIDYLGLLMLVLIGFGWGKPIRINIDNFKNKKLGAVLVNIFPTLLNFIVAFLMYLLGVFIIVKFNIHNENINIIFQIIFSAMSICISIGCFFILPLPPLNGYYLLVELLPYNMSRKLLQYESMGNLILLLLIITGFAGKLIMPLYSAVFNMINIFNI